MSRDEAAEARRLVCSRVYVNLKADDVNLSLQLRKNHVGVDGTASLRCIDELGKVTERHVEAVSVIREQKFQGAREICHTASIPDVADSSEQETP